MIGGEVGWGGGGGMGDNKGKRKLARCWNFFFHLPVLVKLQVGWLT